MVLQIYPDIGLNCILLLQVFFIFLGVFLLTFRSLTMQGTCAIEGNSLHCVEDNECKASAV